MDRDYTIIIPTYNSENLLKNLLSDIIEQKDLYPPDKILIVDDCSTDETKYLHKIYGSEELPIYYHKMPEHVGPLLTEKTGIDKVDTTMFVVLHADTRLGLVKNIRAEHPIDKMICYIVKSTELRGLSVAGVAPWTVQLMAPHRVQGGPRMVMSNDGIPQSPYFDYRFASLANIKYTRFESVHSLDSYGYACLTQAYHDAGGFDENFSPYFFYHDDFWGRVREKGSKLFASTEIIISHPTPSRQHKDETFLSRPDAKLIQRNLAHFWSKWEKHPGIWDRNAVLLSVVETRFLGGNV